MKESLLLAIDASTRDANVAVLAGERVLAEENPALQNRDSERLMPAVEAALKTAGVSVRELAGVACGAGPGSFTGLRIAASIAKGIAMGTGCALYGPSSMLLMLAGLEEMPPVGRYLVLMDALREELYAAEIVVGESAAGGAGSRTFSQVGATGLISAASVSGVARRLGAVTVGAVSAGGVTAGGVRVGGGAEIEAHPRARGVARLLADGLEKVDISAWEPEYGRAAEAQVKWEEKHGRPLPLG
jgi:tRNA threonylcarbamoyladenosine biosynthesis protein TsaB